MLIRFLKFIEVQNSCLDIIFIFLCTADVHKYVMAYLQRQRNIPIEEFLLLSISKKHLENNKMEECGGKNKEREMRESSHLIILVY